MNTVIYTEEFERILYTELRDRFKMLVPDVSIQFHGIMGPIRIMLSKRGASKVLETMLIKNHFIESENDFNYYLDHKRILRLFYADYKIMPYGIELKNISNEGIIGYSFYATGEGGKLIEHSGGCYMHAYSKLKASCPDGFPIHRVQHFYSDIRDIAL